MHMSPTERSSKIGLSRATSLVVGNMIGAGIFLLPASLAVYGSISFIGWILSGIGTLFLAIVFSRLSRVTPATGGPYIYSRQAFGDFVGFLCAWSYWLSILPTNAAISIAFTGYLSIFLPIINSSPVYVSVVAIAILWILTFVNLNGTRTSGTVQLITTVLKITPLIVVSLAGLFFLDLNNFGSFNISGETDFNAVIATLTLTLFALMGIECATIPAGDIEEPHKTIPKATILGTLSVIAIYLVSTFAIMGLIDPLQLQNSSAPFADAAQLVFGSIGGQLIAAGAIVSTLGALNGWILIQGQIPMAIARDGLFPKVLGRTNQKGAPHFAILFSSLLITVLIIANSSKGLVAMFTFMIQITAFAVSIAYVFSAVAEILIIIKSDSIDRKQLGKALIYGIPAFLYSFWAIVGSGLEPVYYGFILLLVGIPVYIWSKFQKE